MLQGRIQSMICSFVFQELPIIYKMVVERKSKAVNDQSKKKTTAEPSVKCDQCKFKSSMIQMKLHIKNVHTRNRRA